MAKSQLVLAFFENEAAADAAVESLKKWGKAGKEIKRGAIAVLVKDEQGKVKEHKLGKRKTKTRALVGALVGILSGGVTLVGGAIVGGILGSFFHKGLGFSKGAATRSARSRPWAATTWATSSTPAARPSWPSPPWRHPRP